MPSRLCLLYGRSLYGALLLVVFAGLLAPAVVGSYLLVGVRERAAAAASLDDTLQRNADILALGIQESLWNMNLEAARPLLDAMLRDPAVAGIEVRDLAGSSVLQLRSQERLLGEVLRAERPVAVGGEGIGSVVIEMDSYRSGRELRAKQRDYALVVAGQVAVSLLLIALLLRRRLLSPLRSLMRFSDRLARGDFQTPLALSAHDELGRLGEQMERMRLAIRDLFADIARREEQFRTIVTQVPGAVYRARAGGQIEFVSDAIAQITGYRAARFMCASTEDWLAIAHPEDRRAYYRATRAAIAAGSAYQLEYRIVDAGGIERWVQEHGQPQDGRDMHMLIRNADVAMYQAKARGRNGYRFYAPSMSADGALRLRMETLLRRAIERREIHLAYQPQVEIDSGRLIGVEALLRWNSPELGQVAPACFIALAEDTGFIGQLGQWVLQDACRQMVAWEAAGLSVPKIAVNLSARQFERGGVAATVAAVLKDAGLAPQRLQLEVTESVIMNTGDALQYVNDLHAVGVGLAIDDFGTGYSSLAYLKQLPVQTLKIDRSFIKDIPQDPDDEAIAIAIIQLGKSMNLSVIAEGVERDDQAAFLLRHGCNRAQGYLYGQPVPGDEILARWGEVQHA